VQGKALVWFRRDLRDDDHAALSHALGGYREVSCAFVFDTEILDVLPDRMDRRVEFIWHSVSELKDRLVAAGGDLIVRYGRAREVIPHLARELGVAAVFANEDYEPDTLARDRVVAQALDAAGIEFRAIKDQVIFARDEILTQARRPFTVFTPYKNAWLKAVNHDVLQAHPVRDRHMHLARSRPVEPLPSLASIGFQSAGILGLGLKPGMSGAEEVLDDFIGRIDHYRERRDYPGVRGVSYLSVHNRFGTVSIRRLARLAWERRTAGADTWLSELIWRDFYFQILYNFPHAATGAFRQEYDAIEWDNSKPLFKAWCEGRTGYPIIDAGMRQLNQTGYMHNRLRMIVASFLVKDLLVDWRWGERYFTERLNDFDLAANNGGWQWAASTGCDAQPYFRIFNPVTQSERFDPQGRFIRRYIPELARVPERCIHAPWQMTEAEQKDAGCVIGADYPFPVVDHAVARMRTLARFKAVAHSAAARRVQKR